MIFNIVTDMPMACVFQYIDATILYMDHTRINLETSNWCVAFLVTFQTDFFCKSKFLFLVDA
jgi:hypothetical protein